MHHLQFQTQKGIGLLEVFTTLLLVAALALAATQIGRDLFSTTTLASQMRSWNRVQSDLSLRIRSGEILPKSAHTTPALAACLETNGEGKADCVSVNRSVRYPLNMDDNKFAARSGSEFNYSADASPCSPKGGVECAVTTRLWFRALCRDEAAACDKAVAVMVGFSIESANPREKIPGLPVQDYVVVETDDIHYWDKPVVNTRRESTEAAAAVTSNERELAAVSLELARRRIEHRLARYLESERFLARNAAENPALKNCLQGGLEKGCRVAGGELSLELRDAFDTVVAGAAAAYDSDGHSCKQRRGTACPITAEVLFSPQCANGAPSCDTATTLAFTIAVRSSLSP
jgi:hypothetical protein